MRLGVLSSIPGTVRELLSLRDAEARSAALPAERRTAAAHTLARAWQKRDAAEILWPRDARAEALQLAAEALRLAKVGVDALAECGADESVMARAKAKLDALEEEGASEAPLFDEDVPDDAEPRFRDRLRALEDVERDVALPSAGPRELGVVRRNRRLYAAALGGVAIAMLALGVRSLLDMHVKASGHYNALTGKSNAFDGDTATEWLMPDKEQTGWLEMWWLRKRPIHEVNILNGHSPGAEDRAIHEFLIVCTDDGHPVKTIHGSFEFTSLPLWRTFQLGGVQCDTLRIEVLSVHRNGGSIAEIDVR